MALSRYKLNKLMQDDEERWAEDGISTESYDEMGLGGRDVFENFENAIRANQMKQLEALQNSGASSDAPNSDTFAKFTEALDKVQKIKNNPFTAFGEIGQSIAKGISLLDPNGDKALLTTEQKVNYANNNIANLSDENKNKLNEYNDLLDELDASRISLTDNFNPEENERFAQNSQRLKDLKASLQQDLNLDDETFNKYVSSSKFLKNLEDRQRQQEEYANASAGEKALANIGDAILAPIRPYTTLKGYLDEKGNPYYDENLGVDHNATGFDLANISRDITTQATKDIEELTGANEEDASFGSKAANEVLKTLYTGVKSGADSMARLATGEVSTLLGAGLEAADQQYVDAGERGLTKAQAIGTAVSSGAAEAVFEKIPVDNMLKLWKNGAEGIAKGGVKAAVKDVLKQAGLEGMEEVETDIANKFSDAIINKDKSEFNTQVEDYKAQGMDEAEAFGRTLLDNVADTVESFAGGAIGGLVGGGGAIAGSVATTKEAKKLDGNYREVAQAIPDNVEDYNSEEDYNKAMEVKARAEELDTQDKVSSADRSGLLQDIYAVNDTMPNTDLIENINESVNSPFADVGGFQVAKNDITSQEVAQSMAQANNVNDFVEAYRDSQASSNVDARQTGQEYFETLAPKFDTYDEGSRPLDLALTQRSAEDLYTAALNGEEVDQEELNTQKKQQLFQRGMLENTVNQRAEAQKQARREEQKTFEPQQLHNIETPQGKADIADITLDNEGNFKWTKGDEEVIVPRKDISDNAMQRFMVNALNQPTLSAKQLYIDNYDGSIPIGSYNNAYESAFNAGKLNSKNFKGWLGSHKFYAKSIPESTLEAFFIEGAKQVENKSKKVTSAKTKGTGKVTAEKSVENTPIHKLAQAFASKTGIDFEIRDGSILVTDGAQNALTDAEGNEIYSNGQFQADISKVLIGANGKELQTFMHEAIGEVLEAYNPEDMADIQDAILNYLLESKGDNYVDKTIKRYQRLYKAAEGTKSYRDAANEMVNDTLIGLFTTDKGAKDFVDWCNSNNKKSTLDKIADFIQAIIDKLKSLISDANLSSEARTVAEMSEKQAQKIRDRLFKAMDKAIDNYKGAEEGKASTNTRHSLDANSGYKGWSMSKRAAEAYENGEMPISKWTKKAIRESVEDYFEGENLNFDMDKLFKLPLPLLKEKLLTRTSWHHTSKVYNSTNFYSIDEQILDIITNDKIDSWREEDKRTKEIIEKQRAEREEKERKEREKTKNVLPFGFDKNVIDKLTPQNAKEFEKEHKPLDFNSKFTHYYRIGRKPSREAYREGLDKWFKKGEKRLEARRVVYEGKQYNIKYLQEWNGTEWVDVPDGEGTSADARFSLAEPVEQKGNLIAVHNRSAQDMLYAIEQGGIAMPSIAVTKADMLHTNFGDVSVLYPSRVIDPQYADNYVYSGDAYTPITPRVEYKTNEDMVRDFGREVKEITKKLPGLYNSVSFYEVNYQDRLNSTGSMYEVFKGNPAVIYAYLKEKNIPIRTPYKDNVYDETKEMAERLLRHYTLEELKSMSENLSKEKNLEVLNVLNQDRLNEYLKDHTQEEYDELPLFEKNMISMYDEEYHPSVRTENEIKDVVKYKTNGAKKVVDYDTLNKRLSKKINKANEEDYKQWLSSKLDKAVIKKQYRNNKDYYTRSGNPRSWNQLHDDYTLDNAIRIMREGAEKGEGEFGYNIFGSSTVNYESIDEIHANEDRLQERDYEEYKQLRSDINDELYRIANHIKPSTSWDVSSAAKGIAEAVATRKTKQGIKNWLSEWYNVEDSDIDDIMDLVQEVREMPTTYFEAKPQRAVTLDEIAKVVVPSDETELITALEENNIPYNTYERDNKDSRREAVNSAVEEKDIRFSLAVDTEGNELTEQQQKFFKDSKVRDENGNLLVVYHGTPNGEFNTFNNRLNFYTANKEYADRYATGSNARQYKGYLNITKPFDITDKETKRIFFDEYVKGGWSYSIDPGISRAELEKRIANGIDWTEADNLKDFIEENELDYDGLILNEGGDPTEDGVRYRGNSYVTFNSNQFKNVDNENPTESEDIRYSLDVPTTYALDEDLTDEQLKELFPGADDDMIEYKDSKELFVNTVMDAASKVLDFNISDSQVNQIAKWLIDTYNSEETEEYISRNLRNIFSGLKTNNYEDMVNALQNLTEEVAEKAKEVDPDDKARYDSFIKSIPTFRFSDYQVKEMQNRGIYNNVFGKIGFKTNSNSTTLDGNTYWEICDAAQAHGYTMKRDVSDLDQIDEISKAIDYFKPQTKPMFEGADITDGALESAREIMRRYFKYAQLANQTDDSLKEVQRELKRQTDEYKKKVGKIYQEQVKKLQDELSQLKDEKKLANMQGQQLYERLAKAENKASDATPSKEEVKQNFKDFSSAMPKFRLTDKQRKQAIEDMGAWNSVWGRLTNYMNKDAQDLDDAMYKQIVELAKQHGFDGMAENTDHKAKEIIRAIAMIKNPSYQGDNKTIKKLSYENWQLNTDLQQAQRMALRDKKSLSRKIERQERNKYLKSIRNQAIRTIKMLENPTRNKFIPEVLQKPTIEMLQTFDFVTYRVRKNGELVPWGEEKGGEPTKTNRMWREKMEKLQGVLSNLEGVQDEEDLSKYGNNSSYLYNLSVQLGDVTKGLLDQFLQDTQKDTVKISTLNSEKLKVLDKFMKSYLASINSAQEAMIDGNNVQLAQVGQSVATEISDLKSVNAVEGTVKKKILDFLNLDMAEPITVFSELGGTMEKLYWHLEKGKDVRDGHIFATEDAFSKAKEELNIDKNEPSKWETGLMSFKDGKLQLTPAQVMSLYAAYGRSQARHHIIFGGVMSSDEGLRGKDKKLKKVQTKPIHLTPKDVEDIVSTLTPQQKALADFMVDYMSNEVSDWGNRVSQKRWGIRLFTESHYFPIKTFDVTRPSRTMDENANASLFSLQNQGFTKPLQKDANNALVLEDIFKVFSDHVAKMAAYDGYVIPINDFMRVFNYAESKEAFAVKQGEEGQHREDSSVKEQIQRVFGTSGTQYFTKFIKNVNEDFGEGGSINLIDKLFSNNKAQAVLANGRVVIQQPTAYPRAMEVIDGKYLVKALSTSAVGLKKKVQRSKSHNTLAKFKSKGYYETSIGQSMQQMITGTATTKDKVNEVAGALAGLADDITWSVIYQAAEYKVQAEQKELEVDSKEYFDAVNKIANEAFVKTQVVDSVFTKSQMMRSRDTGDKMLTAFMAEHTKYYNMLHRGVFNMYQTGNKKAFAKAVYLFVVGQVLNSVAQSAYDAWRDDDDEKDAMEKFLNALLGISDIQEADGVWATIQAILKANLVENLLPTNLLPVVKEVNSALAGWDSKNMSTQAIYDIVGDAEKIANWMQGKGTLTPYGVLNTVAHSLSLATGMPISSALREVKDLYNHVNDLWDGTNLVKNEQKESTKSKIASSENIQETVKTLYQEKVQENLEKGKTQQEAEKAAKSSVGSAITGAYKEQLVEAKNNNMSEATSMKAEAIKGFTALGISQADANKRVEKWFK